jgi:hypothetical protein
MNNIDFDINNYTIKDMLNLLKLTSNCDDEQLLKAKEMVIKLHPDNSQLNRKYYDLFSKAYKFIELHERNKRYKSVELPIEKSDDLIDNPINIINSCYIPSNYSSQIVSIHTEDRDVTKYPYQNNFDIMLPQVFNNVISLELYDITLPTYYFNISETLQNTAIWFSIPFFFTEPIELRMVSGKYTDTNFVYEFIKKINEATTKKLYELNVYAMTSSSYTEFDGSFNVINNRVTIVNKSHEFILWCQKRNVYGSDCLYENWDMSIDWGLPYNLGFDKKQYVSVWDASLNLFVLNAPNQISLGYNNTIYLEIDKFNYINEIIPFSKSTTTYYNNDYAGRVNSAFAKLILSNVTNTYVPVSKFKRVLPHIEEKIGRLKFIFRYHNGNLVDFLDQNFNFSLKMICKFDCKY